MFSPHSNPHSFLIGSQYVYFRCRCTISSSTKRPILNRPQRDLSVYRKSIDKAAGEKDTPDKVSARNWFRYSPLTLKTQNYS